MGRNKLPQGEKLGVLRVQLKEKYLIPELIEELQTIAREAVLKHIAEK
jgi:hypothetical protein